MCGGVAIAKRARPGSWTGVVAPITRRPEPMQLLSAASSLCAVPGSRTGTNRRHCRHACLDGAPSAGPPRSQPAKRPGSHDRAPIRRMEMTRPGELVHVDIKKLGRIPPGGGWRVNGRAVERGRWHRTKVGYAFVHTAIDGYTRLAYSEVFDDEQGITAAAFWRRAEAFLAGHGIAVERVITDNGNCYRSHEFTLGSRAGSPHLHQALSAPDNGKAERFNPTLLAEWAYLRAWRSDPQRTRNLANWLHTYNHHRHHTAIGGPPVSRVGNLSRHYN